MAKRTQPVAKLRVLLVRGGEPWCVLSRKNAPGKPKHGKLEMFGGHLDGKETPREALLRELREEDTSGALANAFERASPGHRTAEVDGAVHHLFELTVSEDVVASLRVGREESLGVELRRAAALDAGALADELTFRTNGILRTFGPATEVRP